MNSHRSSAWCGPRYYAPWWPTGRGARFLSGRHVAMTISMTLHETARYAGELVSFSVHHRGGRERGCRGTGRCGARDGRGALSVELKQVSRIVTEGLVYYAFDRSANIR